MSHQQPQAGPSVDVRPPIPIRHPAFDFAADLPRHWAGGNPLATHIFNALNLQFPDGERFFIRAVNDNLDRVEDPGLVRQARGFAGQEAVHGREHERYFDVLRRQGYSIDRFLAVFRWLDRQVSRLPRSLRLAITAGAEHYTATLGHFALAGDATRSFHPTMEKLVVWHATEEVEHKAVAFDVMQAAGIGYPTRIAGFLLASAVLGGFTAAGARMLLKQDGLGRREIRAARAELRRRDDPVLLRFTGRQLKAYFRRDFHPDEFDDRELAARRLAEVDLKMRAA